MLFIDPEQLETRVHSSKASVSRVESLIVCKSHIVHHDDWRRSYSSYGLLKNMIIFVHHRSTMLYYLGLKEYDHIHHIYLIFIWWIWSYSLINMIIFFNHHVHENGDYDHKNDEYDEDAQTWWIWWRCSMLFSRWSYSYSSLWWRCSNKMMDGKNTHDY